MLAPHTFTRGSTQRRMTFMKAITRGFCAGKAPFPVNQFALTTHALAGIQFSPVDTTTYSEQIALADLQLYEQIA